MTIGTIGFTRLKMHPGFFLVFFGMLVLGMLGEFLQAFLALCMHEAFHAITAHALGCRIESIELLPFGGVAHMETQSLSPRAEFLVAMAGPLCNFIIAGILAVGMRLSLALEAPLQYFLTANLTLALFNLLPALPLDGGRMLRAILLRACRPRAATMVTAWLGVVCGALLFGMSIYMLVQRMLNPFLLVMGIFLTLGAVRELYALPQAQLTAMLRRRDAFSRGEAIPARTIALNADMQATAALQQLSASQYTVLLVLDRDMRIVGQLDEGKLLNGIARYGQNATLAKLL